MADIDEPIDAGRVTHLYLMHRTEHSDGTAIPDGYLLAADGSKGHTWTDPAGITGSTDAADITVADAGGYFTGTDVEAVLQALGATAGKQNHNTLGATETFDGNVAGWHYGTLDQDCTFTLTASSALPVTLLVFEITQDGTGGWDITWPGSVVTDPVTGYDTTLGTTSRFLCSTRDGGTTWYVDLVGGSGGSTVAALDDLTDVVITSVATDDTLRYDGSGWINDNRRWEPVTFDPGTGPEIVFDPTDVVMTWKAY